MAAGEGERELTPEEAARILGLPDGSVGRRVRSDKLRAFQDELGRIRLSASIVFTPPGAPEEDEAETIARLWQELELTSQALSESRSTNQRLQGELEASEKALEYTKAALADLWATVTRRNQAPPSRSSRPAGTGAGPLLDFVQNRTRIQGKITDARNTARRRRWPWMHTA